MLEWRVLLAERVYLAAAVTWMKRSIAACAAICLHFGLHNEYFSLHKRATTRRVAAFETEMWVSTPLRYGVFAYALK